MIAEAHFITLPIREREKRQAQDKGLPPRGGGGTSGGMETSIAKLETLMEVVRTDVSSLKTDIRDVRERMVRIEEKVSHLPTKGWAVTTVVTLLGIITAAVTLAPKLQEFFGIVVR
jgi:hypothetical protein